RLAAGGETLVAALDALDAVGARVREASVLDKGAHAEWQEALRTAARRLEAAWLALETQVADEGRRWEGEIDVVGRWWCCGRRSAWRWYGSDWCWAATSLPPHGSRRASASERRAVTAIGVGVD